MPGEVKPVMSCAVHALAAMSSFELAALKLVRRVEGVYWLGTGGGLDGAWQVSASWNITSSCSASWWISCRARLRLLLESGQSAARSAAGVWKEGVEEVTKNCCGLPTRTRAGVHGERERSVMLGCSLEAQETCGIRLACKW